MTLMSLQFIIQNQDVIICSHVIVIHHLQIFIFIVPFQLFTDVFLSRTSKLPGNRQIGFLSLNKLRFWLFLMLETFVVFLGYIVYNTFFIILLISSLKSNFESIVIPSSVTDETDFVVISPVSNVCKPAFPRIINWKFSGCAFIELYTNHSYTFHVSCIRLVNMLSKFIPQE